MFGMLITPENLPKIYQRVPLTDAEKSLVDNYLSQGEKWYMITGYYTTKGKYFEWVVFPRFLLDKSFEYDHDKIKTQWDQIVRK